MSSDNHQGCQTAGEVLRYEENATSVAVSRFWCSHSWIAGPCDVTKGMNYRSTTSAELAGRSLLKWLPPAVWNYRMLLICFLSLLRNICIENSESLTRFPHAPLTSEPRCSALTHTIMKHRQPDHHIMLLILRCVRCSIIVWWSIGGLGRVLLWKKWEIYTFQTTLS